MNDRRSIAIGIFAATLVASPALAHTGAGSVSGGFLAGFEHPISGLDHIVAMVGVGLWGAFLGFPAIWLLPVVFPLVMTFGGVLGILGVPIPAVETGIAFSAIVLGACIAFGFRAPLWVSACIVGCFAIFHGHAHGAELPNAANPLAYSIGFVLATGLLHLCGIGLGTLTGVKAGGYKVGEYLVRSGGALITLIGFAFLAGYA